MMEHTSLPKTFHIIYAWAEGPWHGKTLAHALKLAGFTETPQHEATILIAHSVGTYLVNPAKSNKIILLIGPPFWPDKSILLRIFQKILADYRIHHHKLWYWIRKMTWNTVYVLTKPVITARAWQAVHQPNPFLHMPDHALIVRNKDDVFCTPHLAELVNVWGISFRGQHDDCWHNPEPYVKLVQAEYAKLLA